MGDTHAGDRAPDPVLGGPPADRRVAGSAVTGSAVARSAVTGSAVAGSAVAESAVPMDAVTVTSRTVSEIVARLRRAMRRAARVALPTVPLSVAQLELLGVVAENPASRPTDLADLLRLAPNSVSTLANALVAAGMLVRSPGSHDRRTVRYLLTERGATAVAAWQDTNTAVLAGAVTALPPAQRDALRAALPVLDALVGQVDAQTDRAIDVPTSGS